MMNTLPLSLLLAFCLTLVFSFDGTAQESSEANLVATVKHLSETIGKRSYRDVSALNQAAEYIDAAFRSYGCSVTKQAFQYQGKTYYNVVGEVKGADPDKKEILIIGAHYDTAVSTPGADDNASGIAGMLELARLTALHPGRRTIRFAAFSLEEPPVFGTEEMGSYFYAKQVKEEGVPVHGMITLEMIGYFCEEKGCQEYPAGVAWLFPDKGNFISFVGNVSSRSLVKRVKNYARTTALPVETLSTFSAVTGVDFSDHRNFWKFGFKAFMITDTSFYRNRNYHQPGDTWEKLDYKRMEQLIAGLYEAILVL